MRKFLSTDAPVRHEGGFDRDGPRRYLTVQMPREHKLRRVRVYMGQDGRHYRLRTYRANGKKRSNKSNRRPPPRRAFDARPRTKQVQEYTFDGRPLGEVLAADLTSAHARAMAMRDARIDSPCLCDEGHET